MGVEKGAIFKTRYGVCEVLDYINNRNVIVKFEDGFQTVCRYSDLLKGSVKNPNYPNVYDVGFIGTGKYNSKNSRQQYTIWRSMLERCYSSNYQEKRKSYIGCSVSKEWHNFQNFVGWFNKNIYYNKGWELDKDTLIKNNKIYSAENCVFLPAELNALFTKSNIKRGKYCIGVSWDKEEGKFIAQCNKGQGRPVKLGRFKTEDEAFQAYKIAKEAFIKQQAEKWKDQIDPRAYEALVKYEVEKGD